MERRNHVLPYLVDIFCEKGGELFGRKTDGKGLPGSRSSGSIRKLLTDPRYGWCIELRKYVDVDKQEGGDHLFLINKDGERYMNVSGQVGFPFFGQFILDCMDRTENATTQEHAL